MIRNSPNAVVELELDGEVRPVMVSDIQRDKVTGSWLHVDFHQVDMREPVKASVRLDVTGTAAGVQAGGMLQVERFEIDIKCLPGDIPAVLAVDASLLEIGQSLHVSDVPIPDGIEVLSD